VKDLDLHGLNNMNPFLLLRYFRRRWIQLICFLYGKFAELRADPLFFHGGFACVRFHRYKWFMGMARGLGLGEIYTI